MIILASSFYTPSLEQPFTDIVLQSGQKHQVTTVPYNQLHSFLLDPGGLIPPETPAIVILILRVEDLIRMRSAAVGTGVSQALVEETERFISILRRSCELRLNMLLCPSGTYTTGLSAREIGISEAKINAELRSHRRHNILLWSHFETMHSTPGPHQTSVIFNPAGDRLGHVPFSAEGLRLIAQFFVDRIVSLPVTELKKDSRADQQLNLRRFLQGLNIRTKITRFSSDSEGLLLNLLRHTTHFVNLPDRRWCADSLRELLDRAEGWLIYVSDRLSDYGISGALIVSVDSRVMHIKLWLLSCPVLGREVEYAVMGWIVDLAKSCGATSIEIPFVKGKDNQVLYRFLIRMFSGALEYCEEVYPTSSTTFKAGVTDVDRAAKCPPSSRTCFSMVAEMGPDGIGPTEAYE